jgi:hypothetical protein
MTEFTDALSTLRRPRLLMRAARIGMADYSRSRDLVRLIRGGGVPSPEGALAVLVPAEAALEQDRVAGRASYSIAHHIEILVAMMAELRLLPARGQV